MPPARTEPAVFPAREPAAPTGTGPPSATGSASGEPSAGGRRTWMALCGRLAVRGLANPRLALDLLRTVWAFRRRHWWRRAPFLPLPDPVYLRWRMYTAYGREDAVPPVQDVVRFVRWRRETMHR